MDNGKSYFDGQEDEQRESKENGDPLEIEGAELEDNEDELIRIMHERFMQGLDGNFVDYAAIDRDEELDDHKQMA